MPTQRAILTHDYFPVARVIINPHARMRSEGLLSEEAGHGHVIRSLIEIPDSQLAFCMEKAID